MQDPSFILKCAWYHCMSTRGRCCPKSSTHTPSWKDKWGWAWPYGHCTSSLHTSYGSLWWSDPLLRSISSPAVSEIPSRHTAARNNTQALASCYSPRIPSSILIHRLTLFVSTNSASSCQKQWPLWGAT